MYVHLENIQGFKGKFEFSLDDLLNNITAKYNGTGKTTFFECIKLLCKRDVFPEDELKFMLNKECTFCKFLVILEGVSYGFTYEKKIVTYIRQYDGGTLEESLTPFNDVCQNLGVYIKNDMFINVCDRFINLLSSSNENLNFELIDALLTHQKLEELISLSEHSLKVNKEHVNAYQNEATYTKSELSRTFKYDKIETFRDWVEDENYIMVHDTLGDIFLFLEKFSPHMDCVDDPPADVVSLLAQSLSYITPEQDLIDEGLIVGISSILSLLDDLNKVQKVSNSIDYSELVTVTSILKEVLGFNRPLMSRELNILTALLSYVVKITPVTNVWVYYPILVFSKLAKDIELYIENNQIIQNASSEIEALKVELEEAKVDCPIHDDVYMVGGACVNV